MNEEAGLHDAINTALFPYIVGVEFFKVFIALILHWSIMNGLCVNVGRGGGHLFSIGGPAPPPSP